MSKEIIPAEQIALGMRTFRGEKVLLGFDLAALYGVAVKVLNQTVKRKSRAIPERREEAQCYCAGMYS